MEKFDSAYLNMIDKKGNPGLQVFAIECNTPIGTCAVVPIVNLTDDGKADIFEIIRDFGEIYESREKVVLISKEDMPTTNFVIGAYGPYGETGNGGNLTMYSGYDFVTNAKELSSCESQEEIDANNRNKEYWNNVVFLCTPQELEANINQLKSVGMDTNVLETKLNEFKGINPMKKLHNPDVVGDIIKLDTIVITD